MFTCPGPWVPHWVQARLHAEPPSGVRSANVVGVVGALDAVVVLPGDGAVLAVVDVVVGSGALSADGNARASPAAAPALHTTNDKRAVNVQYNT